MAAKNQGTRKRRESRSHRDLDDLDWRIISALRSDGRQTATELGRRFDVTEATIRYRIDRLVGQELMKIVAVVDPHKIGYALDTLIGLEVDADKVVSAAEQLTELEAVRYVSIVSGAHNIILAAYFRSNDELMAFVTEGLGSVPGIRSAQSWHLLKTLKRTYDWVRPD